MNGALIYRPNNRKLIAMSFICAIAIHVTAVVLAENKSKPVLMDSTSIGDEVVGVDVPSSPPEVDDVSAPDQAAVTDQEFYDDKVTRPIRPRKKLSVAPIRSSSMGTTTGMRGGSVKALALYAPHPNYPYEARRSGTTGSGVAQLIVNSAAGSVVEARMAQSTGSPILDDATLSAFRRWRFKPGVASNIDVPITYTLTGVSY
jgi:TonB family protein